jgi:antitoxin component YwqK of YwqJK toxin-antitoxin module
MKKIFLLVVVFFISTLSFSQEIVNLVMVGDNGITEDIKKANAFIVVKKYPDGFQRLDYKFNQPLQKLRTFSDSSLTVLQGPYYEYAFMGWLFKSGNYQNNAKDGEWKNYDDTGKVILIEKYDQGVLMETINPDTVKKEKPVESKYDIEASFKKGGKDWINYLSRNLNGGFSCKIT